MADKISIDEYFKRWGKDINKASELFTNNHYYLEGLLILSCYIGAFAAIRYRTLLDGEAYVKIVLEYSGKRAFFEQIDLLFFYQWPHSKLRSNGNYKGLTQHSEILEALKHVYGSEEDIKAKLRYVSPKDFISQIKTAAFPGFDESNLREKLPLFSLAELLYRYLRCDAVHNAEFPFINEIADINGNIRYEPNHAITGTVLLETTRAVQEALWKECQNKAKWPCEL